MSPCRMTGLSPVHDSFLLNEMTLVDENNSSSCRETDDTLQEAYVSYKIQYDDSSGG